MSGSLTGSSSSAGVPSPNLFPFRGLTQRLLPIERVRRLYRRAQQPVNRSLLENVLAEMQVEYRVADQDLTRIPPTGPVVVTANHPFGVLDGAILGALLLRVRSDVKVLTNFLLAGIPELHEHCIFVDPFRGSGSPALNRGALRRAVAWLRAGGVLAMFPAGEVSHIHWRQLEIVDGEWSPAAARLVGLTGADTVPVFFDGRNSVPFQAMGLLHPRLRTAWLLNEFLGQTGKRVEVRIGSVIPAVAVCNARTGSEGANYLRWRTYLLAQRSRCRQRVAPVLHSILPRPTDQPIAPAIAKPLLLAEMESLNGDNCLHENSEFSVHSAEASQIPHVLQELGRQREITFRAAGEGTGRSRDLDEFDHHYKHLLLWSKTNRELAGAYRMGVTGEILPLSGITGLYTHTLFRYDSQFFAHLGPALELGRSFVREEYQRHYAPLLMLWKGIGRFLVRHPELAVLFGAVSISSRYNRVSRELIVRFFQSREHDHSLAGLVTPRRPFQPGWIRPGDCPSACAQLRDLQDLADPIGDLEADGKGIPILLRQYAKLGGHILSFNVDRKFSDVLDGLVLVDLRRTDPAVLARYMGKSGVETFRRYHGVSEFSGEP